MHLWNSRISIVSIAVILCCGQALARIWTDSTGKHKIEGEFVKLADGKVDIRRDDGKLARIPLEKLSGGRPSLVKNTTKPAAQESPFSVTGGDEKPIAKRETAGDTRIPKRFLPKVSEQARKRPSRMRFVPLFARWWERSLMARRW